MSVEHVPLLLALTAALCFAFGLYTFFAPETRESSFVRTNARVVSVLSEGADGRTPTLEWETDGKTIRRGTRYPVTVPLTVGEDLPVCVCSSRFLFFRLYSVVPDDGRSVRRLARDYHIIGAVLMGLGLMLLVPAAILRKLH